MADKISGWANTQMVREVECPRCKQPAGKPCKTSLGRRVFGPHGERSKAYIDKIGKAEFIRRHKSYPGKVRDADIE